MKSSSLHISFLSCYVTDVISSFGKKYDFKIYNVCKLLDLIRVLFTFLDMLSRLSKSGNVQNKLQSHYKTFTYSTVYLCGWSNFIS